MLLALACTEPEPADDGVEPVPYIYDAEDDDTAPLLTTADVEARIADALGLVWEVDANPIFPAYHAAMAAADSGCPNYYDYEGSEYWYDDCTSDAGASFSGYAFNLVYADTPYDTYFLNGEALYGVGTATIDGATLSFGGSAAFYTATPDLPEDDASYYVSTVNQVQGGFAYDGSEADGTWLEEGEAPDLYGYTYYAPSYEGRYAYVDGAVLVDDTPVVFDTVYMYSENLAPDCPNEPFGGMSVRDENGEWYDVVLHGPEEYGAQVDASLCDSCGDVYFHGELLGSACADFAALTDWEQAPW